MSDMPAHTVEDETAKCTANNMMKDENVMQYMLGRIPLKRVASSDEVANLIYFLASSEASYITGSYHPVDGGYLAS